jgi:hypothetical protein
MAETRKLAAILAADVAGYSRLAGADEERTLARLRGLRRHLIDPHRRASRAHSEAHLRWKHHPFLPPFTRPHGVIRRKVVPRGDWFQKGSARNGRKR